MMFREGKEVKGGQNPNNISDQRPEPPEGSNPYTVKEHNRLVQGIKEFLGKKGTKFFRECKAEYGTVSPVISGNPPHPVHFREGMTIRNKLRELTDNQWTAHQYDDRWQKIVEDAIL